MSGEIDRTYRFDMTVNFDVGSYNAAISDDPTGGATAYFTLLWPQDIYNGPMSTRMGARLGVSGYFSGGQNYVDLTPRDENAAGERVSSAGERVRGVRTFLGLDLDVPVSDIISLRFSPGAVFKYDDFKQFDYGAAVVSALMIDLPASMVLMLHFTSDIYTRERTEQFIGGLGLGFTI